MVAVLTKAIQEPQALIEAQNKYISKLEHKNVIENQMLQLRSDCEGSAEVAIRPNPTKNGDH